MTDEAYSFGFSKEVISQINELRKDKSLPPLVESKTADEICYAVNYKKTVKGEGGHPSEIAKKVYSRWLDDGNEASAAYGNMYHKEWHNDYIERN